MNTTLSSARGAFFSRRSIVIPLALLAGALAIAGFWPSYFGPLVQGRPHAEWFIHLHAATCVGWIGLVILQSYLAMTGRVALHIRVGRWGMAYGVALVVSGLGMALFLFARQVAAVGIENTRAPLLAGLSDMTVFSVFLAGAWITRRRPELHRRFILLATNALIIAGVSRLFGGTRSVALGDVVPMVAVWLSPLWIAMLYDWLRHRTVHAVYVFGAVLLIVLRYRQYLRDSDLWERVLHWVAERVV
jgi:hypothetical protein